MSFPISKLIENQGPVVTIDRNETVGTALDKMVTNDYSQLPIVDSSGCLIGIISEQSITNMYFHTRGRVSVLDLRVDNCMAVPLQLTKDADVFEALRRMQDAPALVVVEDKRPIGIITYYDTTDYFRENNEGMMYVADMEQALRDYVNALLGDGERREQALINAFGEDRNNPGVANKRYEKLTLNEQLQLLAHEKNWSIFEPYLQSRDLFLELMNGVRQIRNQLAHFRDPLTRAQRKALEYSRTWLSARPLPQRPVVTAAKAVADIARQGAAIRASGKASARYEPLSIWLEQRPSGDESIRLTFAQVEELLGTKLPESAREHKSWWANDSVGHVQSKYWLEAGWRVAMVDLVMEIVIFERTRPVRYHEFFTDVLDQVQQLRPGLTGNVLPRMRHRLEFGSGLRGVLYRWWFTSRRTLRISLYIDTGDKDRNKRIFDRLRERDAEIEAALPSPLDWERLDEHQASRISIEHVGRITDSPETLSALKGWAAVSMVQFFDVLQPHIERLEGEASPQ